MGVKHPSSDFALAISLGVREHKREPFAGLRRHHDETNVGGIVPELIKMCAPRVRRFGGEALAVTVKGEHLA